MTDQRLPSDRIRTGAVILLATLLAAANFLVSVFLVVMAVPGSGELGPGFKIISTTFLLGNIGLLAFVLWASRSPRKRTQVIALVLQLLTVPLCLGTALAVMYAVGVNDL